MKSYTFLLNFTATEVICLFFFISTFLTIPAMFRNIFRDVNSRSREKHRPTGVSTNTTRCRENGVLKDGLKQKHEKEVVAGKFLHFYIECLYTYSHLWALLVEFLVLAHLFSSLVGLIFISVNFRRVLPTGPGWPLDAVGIGGGLAAQVLSVEVGGVAIAVPPGAVVEGCAVILRVVVVLVLSGEFHAAVFEQRVACSVGSMRDGKKDWGR